MRILIVDDEPLGRSRLKRLLSELKGYECIGEAENARQTKEFINSFQPEVVLLDIAMPDMDGIQLGIEILKFPTPPAVIFVTAHPQHALEAYEASPADYLLKPVSLDRLQHALERVGLHTRAHIERKNVEPKISYMKAGVKRQLEFKEVLFFCAEDKYVRMVFSTGEAIIEQSLVQLLEQFPAQLLRVHRSTLINKMHISRLISGYGRHWVLINGWDGRIEVSRRAVANIRSNLF
jgi:two-component system, LytTR family, response regulator AlgR